MTLLSPGAEGRQLIDGPAGKLEVSLQAGSERGPFSGRGYYAVVAHPHPLYGGTMDNKVVTTVARLYRELGIAVGRFNFRGVGASEGRHDNADGEVLDLRAAANYLQTACAGSRLLIAGYSFGSAVAAAASLSEPLEHLLLIAPPIERYPFAPDGGFPCPLLVVLGSEDDLVDMARAKHWTQALSSPVQCRVIDGADHFFDGQLQALADSIVPVLNEALD